MNAAELVSRLRSLGVSVRLTPVGAVSVRPKKLVPEDLRAELLAHMAEVLTLLGLEREPAPREAGDTRPCCSGSVGDLKADASAVWEILQRVNNPPFLFARGGMLVTIARDDEGRPFVRPLDAPRLAHHLAQTIYFAVERQRGDITMEVPVPPPVALVKELLATPEPPLPTLDRIVATPIVTPCGAIHDVAGYDPESRCVYAPPPGFVVPPVPRAPSPAQVADAVRLLWEPFRDFPLVGDPDRAHTLGALLTLMGRPLISGPTPLFLWEKPSPGTGASLLVNTLVIVATGMRPSAQTEAEDPDEWRKKITAALLEAPSVVFFDNLTGYLDDSHLAAALTTEVWSDRVLGRSETVRLLIRNVWLSTGNNVTLATDLARRTVRAKLDAQVERPWLRARDGHVTFAHPSLLEWVADHRAALVHAGLTLITGWRAAGQPAGTATLGGYEAWSKVVGGILDVAGIPGFLGNLDALYEQNDTEGDEAKRFVARWWQEREEKPTTPAELVALATHPDVGLPVGGKDDVGRAMSLGRWLAKHAGRYYDLDPDLTLTIWRDRGAHRNLWWLTRPEKRATPVAPLAHFAHFAHFSTSARVENRDSVHASESWNGDRDGEKKCAKDAKHAPEPEPVERLEL